MSQVYNNMVRSRGSSTAKPMPTWVILIITLFLVCSAIAIVYYNCDKLRATGFSSLADLGTFFATK